jgi:crotonobetainyl-CoA:carnitine CoA-transferase CaiB-like acyl-CoA transferase
VYALLGEILATRTTSEWLKLLGENDIPAVPLYDLNELIDDRHLDAVKFFQRMNHPSEGALRLTGIPSQWSESTLTITRHPPRLGEHSVEVLREAGLGEAEIEALCSEGATIDGS